MNRVRRNIAAVLSFSLILVLGVFVAAPVLAQAPAEKMPGELADVWRMWPKAGHEMQFEEAIQAHVAWRAKAGEGWNWNAYQPQVGTDMSYFVFRSGDHFWADFDAQAAWEITSKAGVDFQQKVAPHIERYEHSISVEDFAHSQWKPAQDYKYYRVTEYDLEGGQGNSVREAIDTIHKGLVAGGWERSYAISRTIGGAGGLMIVSPYRNYAEMEDPKPSMMEVLTKGAGSAEAAQAALQKFGDGVESTNTTIYVYRPDLSTPK